MPVARQRQQQKLKRSANTSTGTVIQYSEQVNFADIWYFWQGMVAANETRGMSDSISKSLAFYVGLHGGHFCQKTNYAPKVCYGVEIQYLICLNKILCKSWFLSVNDLIGLLVNTCICPIIIMKTILTSRWAGIMLKKRPTGCIDKFCISVLCRLLSTCRSTKPAAIIIKWDIFYFLGCFRSNNPYRNGM